MTGAAARRQRLDALQALRERPGPPTEATLKDAISHASALCARTPEALAAALAGRHPADALEMLWAACLRAGRVSVGGLSSAALVGTLRSSGAREASSLYLGGCKLGVQALDALVRGPWGNLRALSMPRCRINAKLLGSLSRSGAWGKVESLDLSHNPLGDAGAVDLATMARTWPRLRELSLVNARVSAKGLEDLTHSALTAGLTHLKLTHARGGVAEARAIADGPSMTHLSALALMLKRMGRVGLRALLDSPHISGLRSLSVMECGITDDALGELASHEAASALEVLRCRYDPVGDRGLIALARSAGMANLRALQISQCRISTHGVMALADSEHVRGLEALNLSANRRIGIVGIQMLTDAEGMRGLRALDLGSLYLGDEAIRHIVEADPWPSLECLCLGWNTLTDAAVDMLISWPGLARLKALDLGTNEISPEAALRLVSAAGGRLKVLGLWQTPAVRAPRVLEEARERGVEIHQGVQISEQRLFELNLRSLS